MRAVAIILAVFVLGGVAGGAVVYATRPAPACPAPERPGPITPERRTELLTRRLGLTAEQQARVLEILQGHVGRMKANRADLIDAVSEVLDDDQRRRFELLTRGGPE